MPTKDTTPAAANQSVFCTREGFERFMVDKEYRDTTRKLYLTAFDRFIRWLPHDDPDRATIAEAKRHITELKSRIPTNVGALRQEQIGHR